MVTPAFAILLLSYQKAGASIEMSRDKSRSKPISKYAEQQGKRLQQIQISLGFTNNKMAELLKVSKEMYRKYCAGESRLTSEKIYLLYQSTNIDVFYLMTGEKKQRVSFVYLISTMLPDEIKRFIDEVLDYVRTKLYEMLS